MDPTARNRWIAANILPLEAKRAAAPVTYDPSSEARTQ